MPEFVVPAESRSETGKNVNRRLRSRGLIPGVVYGTGKDTVAIAVSPREIGAILKSASGENTLFDLDLGGTRRKVILKEFQREPLRGHLLHADFYEVALDKLLEVKVHVELAGTPVGVKLQGGLVDFVTRELELECLPADIPEKIVVDISHLELGKHLRVSEVNLGDKVKVLTDADLVIAHVVLPRAEVVAETAAVEVAPEAGAAEPEVIKKGKTEKAEGEGDEKADKGAKPEKADKGGKPERGDKGGKPERGEKKERK
jgi:large subunit ribosomal protein L25